MLNDDIINGVILDHINSARKFAEDGNYYRITIQANRILSDAALFGENKEYVTIGLVLRLASMELEAGKNPESESLLLPQKNSITKFIDEIRKLLESDLKSERISSNALWNQYSTFFNEFWRLSRSYIDGKPYQSRTEFVDYAVKWSFEKIVEWYSLESEPRGDPFKGIVNEINRIIRSHGANSRQLAMCSAVNTISWLSDYIIWSKIKQDNTVDKDDVKIEIEKYIQKYTSLFELQETDFYNKIDEYSYVLMKEWRECFIKYYDLYLYQEQGRPRILKAGLDTHKKKKSIKQENSHGGV
ncbi:MAG: hypothetical protein NT131_05965 [Methanomassiliicoccales archaeon]|nr:hypothetical protein [Methanomassiliicoccales archaeon]